jgi:CheY-like chemotaxis protein
MGHDDHLPRDPARPGEWALRVLVVEDCPQTTAHLVEFLRVHGYDACSASDGVTALEKARALEPDAMLLDLNLPGMDGWQVVEQLRRQEARKLPLIIAVTGLADEADRRRSEHVGVDLHLAKPVDLGVLTGILGRFRGILAPG